MSRDGSARGATEPPGALGGLPAWVVIGAMKSGTTTVAMWLSDHPQAWLAPNKELHFFDRPELFDRGEGWYREQFSAAPAGALLGEATPSYMYVPDAIERMADLVPEARLIACLRDPVTRAYSHYWHNRRQMLEERSFADAVAAERAEPTQFPGYLARGRYLPQLERVLGRYPSSALLVVLTDDLEHNPAGQFNAVCRHVGLDPSVVSEVRDRANQHHEYRAPRLYTAMFKYRLWRWLPPPAQRAAASAFRRPAAYPPIDPGLADELYEWFREDDLALAAWLGRELPWR